MRGLSTLLPTCPRWAHEHASRTTAGGAAAKRRKEGELPQMVTQPGKSDAIEHSVYFKVNCEAEFVESITADGDYEVSFDKVATLALSPDAAEKLYWMLSKQIPELRKLAAAFSLN
jgi:hypothetical protein